MRYQGLKFRFTTVVFSIILLFLSSCSRQTDSENDIVKDGASLETKGNASDTGITDDAGGDDVSYCYEAVVYYDSFAYCPNTWHSVSRFNFIEDYSVEKGEKLGETNIDLRGVRYQGAPSDFSSTYELGTELYEIKGWKKERAIIVKSMYFEEVFFRDRKAAYNEPIDLTVLDIFHMTSYDSTIVEVELRSTMDGSWMRTSNSERLISLLNEELPGKELSDVRITGGYEYQVPINLVFADGSELNLLFMPDKKYATLFRGYISISDELSTEITKLYEEGEQYERLTELLPSTGVAYTYPNCRFYMNDQEVNPKGDASWAASGLYNLLEYYKVKPMEQERTGSKVLSVTIDQSEEEDVSVTFLEGEDGQLFLTIDGVFYETVNSSLTYDHLEFSLDDVLPAIVRK